MILFCSKKKCKELENKIIDLQKDLKRKLCKHLNLEIIQRRCYNLLNITYPYNLRCLDCGKTVEYDLSYKKVIEFHIKETQKEFDKIQIKLDQLKKELNIEAKNEKEKLKGV